MGVSLKQWQKMFDVTADLLLEHEEELSKIDAVIGDGDHGLTIAKIARLMKDKATKEYDSAEAYFDDLGWDAINVQGRQCRTIIWYLAQWYEKRTGRSRRCRGVGECTGRTSYHQSGKSWREDNDGCHHPCNRSCKCCSR